MTTAATPAPHPTPPPEAQQQQPLKDEQQKALALNAIRLKAIGDRIRTHLRGMNVLPVAEFTHLVYAFARGIDFAVSAGDIPQMAGDIPGILRKVYELRRETFVQSSLMVLVISCKNACSNKWFQPADSIDILRMANELSGNFCTSPGQPASDSTVLEIISQIMPRYYPRLKFERLITSIEAKVGYDVLMADFFIERDLPRDEKIRLLVVQKENLDASLCVTSPPHVSFLVNGKGVDKRTNVSMESGPQFPTDITKMLKYGANIIQAVGYFNANYIIAVAFVNNLTSFSAPKLDDYAQPVTVCPSGQSILAAGQPRPTGPWICFNPWAVLPGSASFGVGGSGGSGNSGGWRSPLPGLLGPTHQAHTAFAPLQVSPLAQSWDQAGLVAALNQLTLQQLGPWVMDSGATRHMTPMNGYQDPGRDPSLQ